MEPSVQNFLGLVTKKYGQIRRSAEFFSSAIDLVSKQKKSLESDLYYHLNLVRILSILCRFDESHQELDKVLSLYNSKYGQSEIHNNEDDFISRQLKNHVHYVILEAELSSLPCDFHLCESKLAMADQLYSSKMHIDRYYPRHLQSKILFLLRKHRFDEIGPVFDELDKSQSIKFDIIRSQYYLALYQYVIGHRTEGLQTAMNQLTALKAMDILLIERTEFYALIDTLEGQNHMGEVSEELRPWYSHTKSIIQQIIK